MNMTKEEQKKFWTEKGKALLQSARTFFNSRLFYVLETLIACLFVVTYQEVLGAVFFVGMLSVILLVCDDILPTTLPFLLICTFTTNCYDSFNTFMQYIIYAPIAGASLIFHFVVYHKRMRFGHSLEAICCVSIAVLAGGVGRYSIGEYMGGAYYVFGLGIGMAIAYVLMKSQFTVKRDYDFKERFAWIMTMVGLLSVAMIAIGYARKFLNLPSNAYTQGFSSNNLCTMLMFALPFPLYLNKKGSEKWTIFMFVFFGAMLVSTSRGGMLLGGLEFVVCCLYWIFRDENKKMRRIKLFSCVGLVCLFLVCFHGVIIKIIQEKLLAEGAIVGSVRYRMLFQAIENFLKNPLVGTGILDDSIVYGEYRKAGTMAWYHMMIPQVVGSMGLVGVAAYGYQIWDRFRLIFKNRCHWSIILGISYLGILLMSQVNPGEFCPVPFETLTVLLFILQEDRLDEETLPLKRGIEKVL